MPPPLLWRNSLLCVTEWACGCFWRVQTAVLLSWSLESCGSWSSVPFPQKSFFLDHQNVDLSLSSYHSDPVPRYCVPHWLVLQETRLDTDVAQMIASPLAHQHCPWEPLYCGVRCHLFGNDFQSNTHVMLCEAHLSQYFQVNMWKSNESSFPPWSLFHLVYPSDFTGPHLRSHFLRPFLFLTPSPSSSVCHMSDLVDSTLQICPPLFPLYFHSRGAFYN